MRNSIERIGKKAAAFICAVMLSLLLPAAADAASGTVPQPKGPDSVKGKVLDDNGEPLPGASVRIKGTTTGTSTDMNGEFSLKLPDGTRRVTLNISFVGMQSTHTEAVVGKYVTVRLSTSESMLDELIVSGFQTISRERSSGSAVIINKEKLDKIQATNLSAKLEGITPGLTIYNNQMSIRGTSSFSVDATPLLVIDGQPATGVESLDDINPEIIENITVLKDAAATSLYGVRATNGVIVITTKRNRTNKLDVNVTAGFYIKPLPSLDYRHYASTSDIIDLEQEILLSDPDYIKDPAAYFQTKVSKSNAKYMTQVDMLYYRMAHNEITQEQLEEGINALRANDYRKEYRDKLRQMSFTQDYNITLSHGNDRNSFLASLRYQDMGQYEKSNSDNTFSAYMKNDLTLTRWFRMTLGADISMNRSSYTQASQLGETTAMPYDRLYNEDGSPAYRYPYNQVLAETVNETEGLYHMGYNAVEEARHNMLKTDNVYTKLFLQASIDITKDLGLELKAQYERRNVDSKEYDEEESYMMRSLINEFTTEDSRGNLTYNIPQGGRQFTSSLNEKYYNLRGQFNYKKMFGERHDFTALLGGEIREDKYDRYYGEKYGYDDQKLTYSQVDWATLSGKGVSGVLYPSISRRSELLNMASVKHRYVSAYFNSGYTYDSRYSLNFSIRVDQADLFGTDPKYRYRPLWSVGASWNASNETFMKDIEWLNMLKVRCTYGITGNVDQSSSPYLLANFGTSLYTGQTITFITTPPNSSLRWEKTSTVNVGLDYQIFRRVSGSLDFYRKLSSDLLVNKSIDPSLGFNGMARANNGEMQNTGFEMNLQAELLRRKDLSFSAGFSVAYNANKIKKVDYEPTDAIEMITSPTSSYRVGDAYNSLYAYRYAGLSDTGNPQIYNEDGEIVDTKAVRNTGAVIRVGQLTPKWNGALTLDFRYKTLGVFAKVVYYTGHSLRNNVPVLYDAYETLTNGAVNEDIVNRWTPENTDTDIPAMGLHGDTGERNYHWRYADVNVCSASFIKMRNIGVSYSLPARLTAKTKVLKGMTLKLQMDNAFYWAANKHDIDPEAFDANSGSRTDALMPSYIMGVDIKF